MKRAAGTAVGYVRVSTAEQAHSGLGAEAQAERIRAYCTMKGLTLSDTVTDLAVSGGKPLASRPGGAALITALHSRRASVVVVLKLDRAFRNAADCLATVEKWDRTGIALHTVDLGGNSIDSTTAAGKFMLTVLAGAAEMERNLAAERTKAALSVKRARGERISGHIPYGYTLAADGTTLTEDPAEQAVIAEIRAMRRSGATLQAIADMLSARNVPTKRGNGPWRHQVIDALLRRGGRERQAS